jgi:hypothetical protein
MVDEAIRARMKLLYNNGVNCSRDEKKNELVSVTTVASPRILASLSNSSSVSSASPALPAPDPLVGAVTVHVIPKKNQKRKGSTQYQRKLKIKKLAVDRLNECCKKRKCCKKFELSAIQMCREQIHCLPHVVDRRSMVLSQFVRVNKHGQSKLKPAIDGTKVCIKFFCYAFGITNDFVYRILKNGIHPIPSPHQSQKLLHLLEWLNEIKQLGEQQPNSSSIILPYRTRHQLYELYQSDHPHSDRDATPLCSFPYFKYVWAQQLPDLKLRKYLPFSKCNQCIHLREAKAKTQDAAVINSLPFIATHHMFCLCVSRARMHVWYMDVCMYD